MGIILRRRKKRNGLSQLIGWHHIYVLSRAIYNLISFLSGQWWVYQLPAFPSVPIDIGIGTPDRSRYNGYSNVPRNTLDTLQRNL
jgi:hypothetical protein